MTAPADLASFRLVRALQSGQPGAFPTLWNAHAGAIWSVVRALCASDTEAVGWATTFRVDLSERAGSFDASDPVAAQVGLALYAHLKPGFAREAPLPDPPLPATEEGARRVPEAARLLYLVDLFFDVPPEALERIAGRGARRTLDAVHRLMEPGDDTDARLYVHAALMRTAPVDVLILPPGSEAPPPAVGRRMWIPLVLLAGMLGVVWAALRDPPPDLAELDARHRAALQDAPLRGDDPAALGRELVRRGVPALLTDVPDLSAEDLHLLGASIVSGPALVFTYQHGAGLWTLQHLLREPDLSGAVLASRGDLQAHPAPGGDAVLVAWSEGSCTWVLTGSAPPEDVVDLVARIQNRRRSSGVPFLGTEPGAPMGGSSD